MAGHWAVLTLVTVGSREARGTVLHAHPRRRMTGVPVGTLTLVQAAGAPPTRRALLGAVWPHVARLALTHAALRGGRNYCLNMR